VGFFRNKTGKSNCCLIFLGIWYWLDLCINIKLPNKTNTIIIINTQPRFINLACLYFIYRGAILVRTALLQPKEFIAQADVQAVRAIPSIW
jgi:hypothetical protein